MRTLMLLLLLTLPAQAQRVVVVELFTSQGCSSCPPADALLAELARDPLVLPLDLHVTYWNRLGWVDQFSLPEATERQRRFAGLLGLDTIYTPQIVIDGRIDAVGSDRGAVRKAIARARLEQAPPVGLTLAAEGGGLRLQAGAGVGRGTLLLVGFDRQHTTRIGAGENGGRSLTEVNVVRGFAPAGVWSGAAFNEFRPRPAGEQVALLLEAPDGHIIGAAVLP